MELNLTQQERMKWVSDLPGAAQRPALAAVIATSTSCSPEEAKKILLAAPPESKYQRDESCQSGGDGEVVASLRQLGVIAGASTGEADDGSEVVELARSIGLKGFAKGSA